jgi:glycosyltransferase 2 family protein
VPPEDPPLPAPTPSLAKRRWIRGIVQALLVAGVLGLLGWRVSRDASSLRGFTPKMEIGTLVAAFVAAALGYFGMARVYIATLRRVGLYDARYAAFYYRVWLQAYFFKYIPGKVVLVLERAELAKRCGLRPAVSVVLIAWESLLLLLGASALSGLCLAGLSGGAGSALPWLIVSPLLVLGMLAAFPRLLAFAAREPRLRKRFGDLASLDLGRWAQVSLAMGYALVYLCLGTAFFFVCRLFVPFGAADFPGIVFWFVASYVIGWVTSVAPAGIGVREGVLVLGLSHYLPEAQAAAVAVAGRLWLTAVELLCIGCACLIPMPADPPAET